MNAKTGALLMVAALIGAGVAATAGPTLLSDEGDDPGPPRIRLRVQNRGPDHLGQDADARLRVERDGTVVFEKDLDIAPNTTGEQTLQLPSAVYIVTVNVTVSDGGSSTWDTIGGVVDTRSCPGLFRASFSILLTVDGTASRHYRGPEGAGVSSGHAAGGYSWVESGCTVPPVGYEAIRREAEAVIEDPPSGDDAIEVGRPKVGDVGTYRYVPVGADSPADDDTSVRWGWHRFEGYPDAWGRPVDGFEVRRQVSLKHFHPLEERYVQTNVSSDLRYRPTDIAPFARFGLGFEARSVSSTIFHGVERGVQERTLEYQDGLSPDSCIHRFPLQGATIEEGQRLDPSRLCPLARNAPTLTTGEVVRRDGFRLMPFYALEDRNGATGLVRGWLADGVPYVIGVESYFVRDAGLSHSGSRQLTAFDPGEDPLPDPAGESPSTPDPQLTPIDPLEGPDASDVEDRFPYTLAEASRDARQDPMLYDLQSLLQDEEAVLAGAVFRVRSDLRNGTAPAGGDGLLWHLVFTAPDRDPVHVTCERSRGDVEDTVIASPQGRCEEEFSAPPWAGSVADPPPLGRSDLPNEGAGFAAPLERWDMAAPDQAGDPVSYAAFRPWSLESISWSEEIRVPLVAAGSALPLEGSALPSSDRADTVQVRVNLTSGRTDSIRYGHEWRSRSLLGDGAPATPSSSLVGSPSVAAGGQVPFVVGIGATGAALGILGLIALALTKGKTIAAGLYSRIGRDDALDHEIRGKIRDLVEEDPGVHAQAIGDELDLARGQTRHHLRVLTREEILVEVASSGYRRFFVAGTYDVSQMRAMAALRNGQNAKAFRVIRENPGIGVSDLADRAGISASYASKTVDDLCEVGLVDKVRDGRTAKLYADEEPRDGA